MRTRRDITGDISVIFSIIFTFLPLPLDTKIATKTMTTLTLVLPTINNTNRLRAASARSAQYHADGQNSLLRPSMPV